MRELLHEAVRVQRSDGVISLLQRVNDYAAWRLSRYLWPVRNFARTVHHRIRYDAPTDVYRPLDVSPASITQYTWGVSKASGLGRIEGGTWETESLPLSERWECQGLKQRFVDGLDWEDTEYVQYPHERYFSNGQGVWGYDSVDEFVDHRCSYVDELYESMKQNGYERDRSGTDGVPGMDIRHIGYYHNFDPLVCIGADGTIYHRDGYHRLMIAKALDLDAIPVLVLARHPGWQEVRERVYRRQYIDNPEHRGHPDLTPLID